MNCRTIALIILVLLVAGMRQAMYGQGYVLTHYTSKKGIGHDHVRAIVADSSGFVWMATWDGLTRYDGTDFVNYFHDPADSTSLPYFSVSHIVVDSRDNLWVSTDNGLLSLFDRATEEFRIIRDLGGIQLDDLTYFSPGPDGFLWILLGKGILRYDPMTRNAVFHPWKEGHHKVPYMRFFSYRLVFSDDGIPWLAGKEMIEAELGYEKSDGSNYASVKGLYELSRLPGRVGTFFNDSGFARIINDGNGNTWLAAGTGLFRLDRKAGTFTEYGGRAGEIPFVSDTPIVFYNHETGLNVIKSGRDTVITIPNSICGLPVCYFFHDPDMLWFSYSLEGGTPSGVMKVVFIPSEFRHINPFPVTSGTLTVFGIANDEKGGLWLAARDRNYLIRITPEGRPERINVLNDNDLAELWHPRSFLPDTGGMWIGYYNRKLMHYDLATGRMEDHFPAGMVHTMCYDSGGNILIADEGVISYNPSTRKSARLFAIGDSLNIFTFHMQGETLWAGCSHSYLIRYDRDAGKPEHIRITRGITNIEDICDGGDGILWLATLGSGVCRYNTNTGEILFYTTATGLSNNTTYSLLRDKQGNIWVSTNNGLSVINPGSGLIRTFGENDGLSLHEFNSDASWITPAGNFLFGGVGGAVEFNPYELLRNQSGTSNHGIIILDFEVSALRRIFKNAVYRTDTVILRKGDDNFHLSFVVPEYRHPEMIRYRYRLGGEGANWYYTDYNDRNINFSNLRPGWHSLDIEATDYDGSWSNSKNLMIRLKPAFYQTMSFRIITPFLLLAMTILLGYTIVRQLHQREKQKRDMLRHQALRGQMNPHFIFNALNSINYFISNNDRLSANRYIADFSRLIRTVLNNMNEDHVKLSVEISALEEYLKIEHLRFGDKFDYTIDVEKGLQPEAFSVSPGLVQPFVENAIWHGVMGLVDRKGIISLDFRNRDGMLVCIVEDDGVGRTRSEEMKDRSKHSRSRGIDLAIERMKIINNIMLSSYRITISDLYPDRFETGTRVEIEMPVIT